MLVDRSLKRSICCVKLCTAYSRDCPVVTRKGQSLDSSSRSSRAVCWSVPYIASSGDLPYFATKFSMRRSESVIGSHIQCVSSLSHVKWVPPDPHDPSGRLMVCSGGCCSTKSLAVVNSTLGFAAKRRSTALIHKMPSNHQ